MRLFYVDDSGNEHFTTFTAVSVSARDWTAALGSWLAWRRHLRDAHSVDVLARLHAVQWVAGRGRPASPDAAINRSKPLRWEEYTNALAAVARMPDVQILTALAGGDDRRAAYRVLMCWIDELLRRSDDHGLVVVDGDNAELRTAHRELDIDTRRIVEDPWKRDARESQWPQAADFVAHAAFQHVVRRPSRAYMWEWYEDRLAAHIVRDPDGRDGIRGWNDEGPPVGDPP